MTIPSKIREFHDCIVCDPHHRYRSWEHCYAYFRQIKPEGIAAQREHAALQLGFYLASWGMYRGSSFLLQRAYTVHSEVIDVLAAPRFSTLWEEEFGSGKSDAKIAPLILNLAEAVKAAYKPFAPTADSKQPTDTLVTKVILGTLGCLPACDRYFLDGFKRKGFSYSSLNARFIQRISDFCQSNLQEFRNEQARIERSTGMRYPLMKLVDMYFWQIGYEMDEASAAT